PTPPRPAGPEPRPPAPPPQPPAPPPPPPATHAAGPLRNPAQPAAARHRRSRQQPCSVQPPGTTRTRHHRDAAPDQNPTRPPTHETSRTTAGSSGYDPAAARTCRPESPRRPGRPLAGLIDALLNAPDARALATKRA